MGHHRFSRQVSSHHTELSKPAVSHQGSDCFHLTNSSNCGIPFLLQDCICLGCSGILLSCRIHNLMLVDIVFITLFEKGSWPVWKWPYRTKAEQNKQQDHTSPQLQLQILNPFLASSSDTAKEPSLDCPTTDFILSPATKPASKTSLTWPFSLTLKGTNNFYTGKRNEHHTYHERLTFILFKEWLTRQVVGSLCWKNFGHNRTRNSSFCQWGLDRPKWTSPCGEEWNTSQTNEIYHL